VVHEGLVGERLLAGQVRWCLADGVEGRQRLAVLEPVAFQRA
jgi:hypothetical protein